VITIAKRIGADALLGTGNPYVRFEGPDKLQYRNIAETTVAVLNQGASFADLGLSEDSIDGLVNSSQTIGGFLGALRDAIQAQERYVQKLLEQEKARLWVVVVAGNEPNQEVAALTRGRYAAIDIERLMTATEANIVQELKAFPERLGILATALDAKILHLPVLCALSVARAFANDPLKLRMKQVNLSLKPDKIADAVARLQATELSRIFSSQSQGVLATGKKLGSSSVEAFSKLADIASTNDVALNRTIGLALQSADLISGFSLEADFGSGLTRRTDIVASTGGSNIRLEIMWRRKTSRADIANYTLTKLANYGRALGYLK
jgi:DNA (cytosine-5)-methyltransferase 1